MTFFKKDAQGFSLVEILVVLILISLITTLIVYGISLGGQVYKRTQDIVLSSDRVRLAEVWFRNTLSSSVAYKNGALSFSGSENSISGVTTQPLNKTGNAPESFFWSIGIDAPGAELALFYKEGNDESEPARILGLESSQANFAFVDRTGETFSEWTAKPNDILPTLVELRVEGEIFWQQYLFGPKAGIYEYDRFGDF